MKDKRLIVTGGASGFGEGIVRSCVAAGARVGILDINDAARDALATELGAQALSLRGDVTDRAGITTAVDEFETWCGGIDGLVNNAGLAHPPTPLESLDEDTFDRVFAVNMKAVFHLSQVVVPKLRANGGGSILNIASTAGVSPRPMLTWYNASKGWLITTTKSMAVELAADNIRVNALNPVAGDTPMLPTFLGEDTPERRQQFLDTIPLGRFSTPDDIGQAAAFLLSDAASMITGVAMEIDGGRCI